MNILVLNGSPKGTKSNTYRITSAFLDGIAAELGGAANIEIFDGTERVFEIYYTDVQVGYQLVLGKERCTVRTTDFTPFLTKVETPLSVWQDIAKGVYNGAQAMMEGKYKTIGDLKFLMAWERYFGGASRTASAEKKPVKKANKKEQHDAYAYIVDVGVDAIAN